MQQTKSLFKSKTFWIATAQSLAGVLLTFSTAYPKVGAFLVIKGLIDIALRVATEQPVTL